MVRTPLLARKSIRSWLRRESLMRRAMAAIGIPLRAKYAPSSSQLPMWPVIDDARRGRARDLVPVLPALDRDVLVEVRPDVVELRQLDEAARDVAERGARDVVAPRAGGSVSPKAIARCSSASRRSPRQAIVDRGRQRDRRRASAPASDAATATAERASIDASEHARIIARRRSDRLDAAHGQACGECRGGGRLYRHRRTRTRRAGCFAFLGLGPSARAPQATPAFRSRAGE